MLNKLQPEPVKKYFCPKCKELQLKVYPWASFAISLDPGNKIPLCKKCVNELRTLKV